MISRVEKKKKKKKIQPKLVSGWVNAKKWAVKKNWNSINHFSRSSRKNWRKSSRGGKSELELRRSRWERSKARAVVCGREFVGKRNSRCHLEPPWSPSILHRQPATGDEWPTVNPDMDKLLFGCEPCCDRLKDIRTGIGVYRDTQIFYLKYSK